MSKIVDEPEAYFRRFVRTDDPLLQELELEADAEHIPIVGPVVGELLYVLSRAISARSILELGTATGYSAIFLARACAMNAGMLTTLELDPALAARARKNLERAGLKDQATVVCGDALAHLPQIEGGFDLIFMDIEKADYARALPECHRLLRPRGLLVADNVAFPDADPFSRAIFSDNGWRPVSLFAFLPGHSPERDALCFALRC
jgi:predicted O-methyltransferase YrrM